METMLVMFEKMSAVGTEFEGDEVEANNEYEYRLFERNDF